jgi:hypothetical protein
VSSRSFGKATVSGYLSDQIRLVIPGTNQSLSYALIKVFPFMRSRPDATPSMILSHRLTLSHLNDIEKPSLN